MSTAQVADHLGMSRDALNAKIRAGEFDAPDAVIGDRFQGWKAATVENIRQRMEESGGTPRCDTAELACLITKLRRVAEIIRAYGVAPDGGVGITVTTPTNLHLIATRLELALRDIALLERRNAQALRSIGADATTTQPAEALPLDLEPVDSVVPEHPLTTDQRMSQIRGAWLRLGEVIDQLPATMGGNSGRLAAQKLHAERDSLGTYIDSYGFRSTRLSDPENVQSVASL